MEKKFICLVFPGVDDVRASLPLLHIQFISDDLPTFERPTMAISIFVFSGGVSFFTRLVTKLAFLIVKSDI